MKKKTKEAAPVAVPAPEEAAVETPAVAEEPAPKEEKKAKKPEAPKTVVYLGPNIEFVVNHGTVFTDGVPEPLQAKIQQIPAIKGLLVPLDKYADGETEIARGGRLKALYDLVKSKL